MRSTDEQQVRGRVAGGLRAAVAGSLVLVAAGVGTAAAADAADRRRVWVPPARTIVKVVGDAADGFVVHRYDGSVLYLPTDSEAGAECEEHDTEVAREVCKAEVRTWHRDLRETKRAIAWTRYSERHR